MKEINLKGLAKIPTSMPRSGIREVMELASQLEDVIHLEVGEPNFPTPTHIIDAAFEAARQGYTRYTSNAGLPSLRKAISNKLIRINGLEVPIENITTTIGAVGGLSSALMALVDPGDEVLIPDPGWPNYNSMVLMTGAKVVKYPLYSKNGFIPDPCDIDKLINNRTKAIIVNTPSNPCGTVIPESEVLSLREIAKKNGIYIISDEVYEDIIFDVKHVSFASVEDESNTISVFSFSKTYSMTGWRIGYTVAPQRIAGIINKLQEPFVSCAPAVSQKAAEAALLGPQDFLREQRDAYKKRRDLVVQLLKDAHLLVNIPQGAFYIMADISSTGMDTYDFAKGLLKEERVAVAPGTTFGNNASSHVRLSLAVEENLLVKGVQKICNYCLKHSTGK